MGGDEQGRWDAGGISDGSGDFRSEGGSEGGWDDDGGAGWMSDGSEGGVREEAWDGSVPVGVDAVQLKFLMVATDALHQYA